MLEGSEFVEFFHSDGSMEDWGYKYTITPTFPARPKAVNATHWMVRLEFELVQCTAALASALVVGLPWQETLETEVAPWMADPLIRCVLLYFPFPFFGKLICWLNKLNFSVAFFNELNHFLFDILTSLTFSSASQA